MSDVTCCTCGVTISLTNGHERVLRRDGTTFCCPNGHPQYFTDSDATKIKKLRKRIEELKKDNKEAWQLYRERGAEIDSLERSIRGHKGSYGRLWKRFDDLRELLNGEGDDEGE